MTTLVTQRLTADVERTVSAFDYAEWGKNILKSHEKFYE